MKQTSCSAVVYKLEEQDQKNKMTLQGTIVTQGQSYRRQNFNELDEGLARMMPKRASIPRQLVLHYVAVWFDQADPVGSWVRVCFQMRQRMSED